MSKPHNIFTKCNL